MYSNSEVCSESGRACRGRPYLNERGLGLGPFLNFGGPPLRSLRSLRGSRGAACLSRAPAEVCHFQCPEVCHFRCPLTAGDSRLLLAAGCSHSPKTAQVVLSPDCTPQQGGGARSGGRVAGAAAQMTGSLASLLMTPRTNRFAAPRGDGLARRRGPAACCRPDMPGSVGNRPSDRVRLRSRCGSGRTARYRAAGIHTASLSGFPLSDVHTDRKGGRSHSFRANRPGLAPRFGVRCRAPPTAPSCSGTSPGFAAIS